MPAHQGIKRSLFAGNALPSAQLLLPVVEARRAVHASTPGDKMQSLCWQRPALSPTAFARGRGLRRAVHASTPGDKTQSPYWQRPALSPTAFARGRGSPCRACQHTRG